MSFSFSAKSPEDRKVYGIQLPHKYLLIMGECLICVTYNMKILLNQLK